MHIRNVFFVLVLTLLYSSGSVAQDLKLEEFKDFFYEERYQTVITKYNDLDGHVSTSDSTLYYLGLSQFYTGDYSSAKTSLDKIQTLEGSYKKKYTYTLAKIYEFEANIGKAIKHYRLLLEIDSTNAGYWRNYAGLCRQGSWGEEAYKAYHKALKLNPKDAQSTFGLIEHLISKDSIVKSTLLIEDFLTKNQGNPRGLNYGAKLAYVNRQYPKVVDYLKSHERITGLNYVQQKLLGQAYLRIDSFDLAIVYFRQSLLEEKDPEMTLYNMGLCYLNKNDVPIAMKFFDDAVKNGISPNLDIYLKTLGSLALQEGQIKQSLDYYKKSYCIKEDAESLYQLASVSEKYYADKSIALNYYRKFIKKGEGSPTQIKFALYKIQKLKEDKHQKTRI